ncbi:uncharacterized protein LOC142610477 [Castanea sativa]|uniref:uncharacterized protein LOC142610477 n=1 Tax=Castanea sativa TaxID=21020 RepID=UPI003F64B446
MSCLVWTCRGLGNLCIEKELGVLVWAKDPSVIFLAETWTNEARLKDIKRNLEFDNVFVEILMRFLRSNEKHGGNTRSQSQMQLFRDVIDECGFLDLGFVGPQFTWSKHYAAGHSAWERRLEVDRKKKIFRFEEMWLSDKGCSNTAEDVWLSHDFDHKNNRVLKKIEKYGTKLTKWSCENFGSVRNELEKKRTQLAEAKKDAMNFGLNNRVRELKNEIENLLDKENRMWLQRSKTLWAAQGYRNTRFFHCKETNRYRKNFIHELRKLDEQWSANNEEVADILIQYHKELFTLANPTFPEEVLLSIHTRVSAQMNNKLSADVRHGKSTKQ